MTRQLKYVSTFLKQYNIERIRMNDGKESDFDKVVKQIETKANRISKNKGKNRKND